MRTIPKHFAATAFTILLGCYSVDTAAGEITTEVLQYKLGNLYFGCGEESNIFAGSPFTLYCQGDSLCSGKIEFSFAGVSISGDIDSTNIPDLLDSCHVVIQAAELQVGAVLGFGTRISLESLVNTSDKSLTGQSTAILITGDMFADDTLSGRKLLFERTGDTLIGRVESYADDDTSAFLQSLSLIYYDNDDAMIYAFETGRLDGCISYSRLRGISDETDELYHPAPLIAVLTPNLSRKINELGSLTTSLYYRFDHDRLQVYFEGDRIRPYNTFFTHEKPTPRVFPHDPEKGRRLFTRLGDRPRFLSIFAAQPELVQTANYFSDVLSRDRCRTELVDKRGDADIYIEFIPNKSQDVYEGYRYIIDELTQDTIAGSREAEIVLMAITQLEWAISSADRSGPTHYLKLIERRMIDDLGLFPLFRPSVFVTTRKQIKGVRFDSDGCLDLSNLRRVILPGSDRGRIQ
jgi:hypothetical protein